MPPSGEKEKPDVMGYARDLDELLTHINSYKSGQSLRRTIGQMIDHLCPHSSEESKEDIVRIIKENPKDAARDILKEMRKGLAVGHVAPENPKELREKIRKWKKLLTLREELNESDLKPPSKNRNLNMNRLEKEIDELEEQLIVPLFEYPKQNNEPRS